MADNRKRAFWGLFTNAFFGKPLASVPLAPSLDGDDRRLNGELAAASGSADLAARVAAIYAQTPTAVLSLEEVAERLEVSNGICGEVMTTLVRCRLLRCTGRGEYVIR